MESKTKSSKEDTINETSEVDSTAGTSMDGSMDGSDQTARSANTDLTGTMGSKLTIKSKL